MDYCDIDEAKAKNGLRLTLTAGVPAPWSESAKAIFNYKKIPFTPVAQVVGEANEELVAWTGHRNAPTAMYNDEPPRVTWLDIVNLAERLQPQPALFPEPAEERIRMVGMLNELAGENGMLWSARQMMFRSMVETFGEDALKDNPMARDYRYSEAAAAAAPRRVIEILTGLDAQLEKQAGANCLFFFGDTVSALDFYWACFSQVLSTMPEEVNPMPKGARKAWTGTTSALKAAGYNPAQSLLDHRQMMYEEYIGLPLDF